MNVAWFACILGAARGMPWLGPIVVAVLAAIHVARIGQPGRLATLFLAAAVGGYLVDSALVLGGIMTFPETARLGGPSTIWMVALWINLATTLHGCMHWLLDRPLAAAALGAIGGPLAYLGGERLGAVDFADPRAMSIAAVALAWVVSMPLLALAGRRARVEVST